MIQLSPPISFKKPINQTEFVSLPEITSILHSQNNIAMNNFQGIGIVSAVYID